MLLQDKDGNWYKPQIETITDAKRAKGGWFEMDANGFGNWVNAKDYYEEKGLAGLMSGSSLPAKEVEIIQDGLAFLTGEKKALANLINDIGKKTGLSQTEINKLKIEVNAKGEIVVGGIKDQKKLNTIAKALNKEDGLSSRIQNFQTGEMILQYKTGAFQRGDGEGLTLTTVGDNPRCSDTEPGFKLLQAGNSVYNLPEEIKNAASLDDITGYSDPVAYALADYFLDVPESADFSSGPKGVANPLAALEHWKEDLADKLENKVKNLNEINDAQGNPEFNISLDNISFKITDSGDVEIIGRLADSTPIDDETRLILEGLIRESIYETSDFGRESTFETAMTSMMMMHDSAFGEGADKTGVMEFGPSGFKAYVDAPERKEELEQEISANTAAYVNNILGESAIVSADDFTVTDFGRIVYEGDQDSTTGKAVATALRDMNSGIRQINNDNTGILDMSTPVNQAAATMASLLAEYRSYGPDGNNGYLNPVSIEEEMFLEYDTYMDFTSRYDYKSDPPSGTYREGDKKVSFGKYTYQQYHNEESRAEIIYGYAKSRHMMKT